MTKLFAAPRERARARRGTDVVLLVASLLPYLQAAAFAPSLRRALKAAGVDADELRKQAAAAVGVEPPDVFRLRRVMVWSVAQPALLLLAASTILSAAADVDWGQVRSAYEDVVGVGRARGSWSHSSPG